MDNIQAVLQNHLTFIDKTTGEVLAIEVQNGVLKRYDCRPATNSSSNQLFGANLPPKSIIRGTDTL